MLKWKWQRGKIGRSILKMEFLGLTILNEQLDNRPKAKAYTSSHVGADPHTSILVYIKAVEFLLKELSNLQTLAMSANTSEELGDARITAYEKVELCKRVLKEFKMGFIAPEDYKYAKEIKEYFDRFLYIEERVNLYYATFSLQYLQQAIKQLQAVMESFKRVKDIINNQTSVGTKSSEVETVDGLQSNVISADQVFAGISV